MTAQGEVHTEKRKITVGEFREFVSRTSYLTDCERQGSGWIFVRKKWEQRPDSSWDNPYVEQEEEDPVVLVSWYDAVMFANWKSAREGLGQVYTFGASDGECLVGIDPAATGYRLPTESEWEAAPTISAAPRLPRAKSQQNAKPVEQPLPGGRWCGGGWPSDSLEWCWDPWAPDDSVGNVDHCASGFAQSRICRGRGIVKQDGQFEPSRGACDPSTAATTLGFSLIKAT
ncbi:SUMF1/EgtB/PvdO family nonheme iron enzyme [Rhizobium sp. Leaf386]|uniref:SUMF1/EgtB/PvdO family nonheme iron enzyme n=1 Tax=Rhizobium sp. Leaf386 TaxID=1736359 RepID=UPI0007123365|nr:SUMF1/EgtB/PvdO family nonheme iron enzyme [Rhizobium sp. Leaf386]KQS95521.1 hypothetical protein ASG50_24765 [Rhizobium sp. Leaf386]